MALVLNGSHSSRPSLLYELHATQTGGSGNNRTVKLTLKLKCGGTSESWYGYPMNWRGYVNGTWGSWTHAKGTETWRGGMDWREYTWSYTTNVGTSSSKAITVGFATDSHTGDNSWDTSKTGSFTVGATNVAPVLSGTVTTSPSGIIPENTKSIKVTSPVATDANGNLAGYSAQVSINGGGWSKIYTGASREFTHDVSKYMEQGTTFKYAFEAYDSSNAYSSFIYSGVVTRNKFSGDTLASSSSIAFDTASIAFTSSGATNTNGNTSFTRTLTCSGITVYNNTTTGTSWNVTIYKSGTVPTTPYIKFNDIKAKFASTSYKGTLTFTVTTKNAYGSTKTSSKNISVNLQTTPNAVGSCSIATDANSTAYLTVASTKNKYFIPDGSKVVRVNWTAGSGKLGEAVSYDVFVAYGSGSWSKVATVSTLYYNHVIPKQTVSQAFKYKIRTKTAYGTYADRDTSAQTLHFYNPPSLTTGAITRSATTCDVQVTVKSHSSIPNINTVGSWKVYNKGTTTVVGNSGNLTVTQNVQTIKVTGLTDSGQYDLIVTYKDDTGFSANKPETIVIGANSPVFFVNKYGAGVNGVKATATNSLNVMGGIGLAGEYYDEATKTNKVYQSTFVKPYHVDQYGLTVAIGAGGITAIGGGESAQSLLNQPEIAKEGEKLYLSADSSIEFYSNCNTIGERTYSVLNASGNLHVHGGVYAHLNGNSSGVKCWDRKDLPAPAFLTKVNDTSYWGLASSATSEASWMRTPVNGLLPNVSNGASGNGGSALGTTSWRFSNVWSTSFNDVKLSAGSSNALTVTTAHGYVTIGANNTGHCHYITDRADHWFDRAVKVKGELYAGANYDQRVYHAGWCGVTNKDLPRVTNLNTIYVSGWHSWSGGGTGTPTTYGVVFTMIWGTAGDSTADRYQLAMGSNGVTYCRQYVNKAWSSWRTV